MTHGGKRIGAGESNTDEWYGFGVIKNRIREKRAMGGKVIL